MTGKELQKLSRQDFLELLVTQGQQMAELQQQLEETTAALQESQDMNERLKEKLNEKDELIEKLKGRLDQKDAAIRDSQGEIEDVQLQKDETIERLKEKLNEKDGLIEKLKGRLDQKDATLRNNREEMEGMQILMNETIAAMEQVKADGGQLKARVNEKNELILRMKGFLDQRDAVIKNLREGLQSQMNECAAAKEQAQLADGRFKQQLNDKDKFIERIKGSLEQKDNVIQSLENEKTSQQRLMNKTAAELEQTQATNERLKEKLNEKDGLIEKLKQRLDQKDATIHDLRDEKTEKDRGYVASEQLKDKDELIESLKERVEQKEAEVMRLREELNAILVNRRIALDEAGSIADASLQLSGVFDAAQQAAELYLDNLRALCLAKYGDLANIADFPAVAPIKRSETAGSSEAERSGFIAAIEQKCGAFSGYLSRKNR